MTTHYTCLECDVSFDAKDEDALLKAINASDEEERADLEDAFLEFGFVLNRDNETLSLEPADGYVDTRWDAFFAAIAPHAAPESLFAVIDEHVSFYGWRIREGRARSVYADITWVDVE